MVVHLTWKGIGLTLMFFIFLVVIPLLLFLNEELFEQWFQGASGLVVIFGIALVGNLTIVLPAPAMGVTMPVIVRIADQEGLILVAGVYAVGSAIGESSAYFLGKGGRSIAAFENSRLRRVLEKRLMGRFTGVYLGFLSFFPIFLPFDVGGMIAGTIKYPYWRFLVATALGRWVKYLLFIPSWEKVVGLQGYWGWAAIGVIAISMLVLLWWQRTMFLEQADWLHARWQEIRESGIRFQIG